MQLSKEVFRNRKSQEIKQKSLEINLKTRRENLKNIRL